MASHNYLPGAGASALAADVAVLPERDVPVLPDGDQARQWAIDELGKAVYQEAKPSLIDQALAAVADWLASLLNSIQSVNANAGIVVIIVAAVLIIGLAIWLVRPRVNRKLSSRVEVFEGDRTLGSEEHRELAREAASHGAFGLAVAEQFRAIVRTAEERVVIDPQPGRTADEVTRQLCAAFNSQRTALREAGRMFNAVRYGNVAAGAGDYAALVRLDGRLQTLKPDYARSASADLVSPR